MSSTSLFSNLKDRQHVDNFVSDYAYIIQLCNASNPIPAISEIDTLKLLNMMKPNVADYFSITTSHYLNAGPPGWKHFCLLLNILLLKVSNTTISEVNTAYACILFKGHNKDRTLSTTYRTISTCPVVAKALDMFIRKLFESSGTLIRRKLSSKEWGAPMSLQLFC